MSEASTSKRPHMSDIAPLRKRGHELMSMFDESLNWLKKSGNLDRHNKGKLEDAQRTVRKVTRVLDKKPVFGLFGRSQAGKSYLAHIILSDSTSSLKMNSEKRKSTSLKTSTLQAVNRQELSLDLR